MHFVYTTNNKQLEVSRQPQCLPVNVVSSDLAWKFGTHDPTWVNTHSLHHASLDQNPLLSPMQQTGSSRKQPPEYQEQKAF